MLYKGWSTYSNSSLRTTLAPSPPPRTLDGVCWLGCCIIYAPLHVGVVFLRQQHLPFYSSPRLVLVAVRIQLHITPLFVITITEDFGSSSHPRKDPLTLLIVIVDYRLRRAQLLY